MNLRAMLSLAGNASISAIAVFAAAPVYAQGANDAVDNNPIIVTGSRIARPVTDRKEPTIVVGSDLIDQQGDLTIGETLKAIPAFAPPASSPIGTQSGSFGAGQSFVDFFGLGSQRTLVLVNGRRFVSSNTASIFGPTAAGSQVDLNTIPTMMVDRIETVAVGGAPIYGSDAIAGTVNIILKDKYHGIKLGGETGISSRHDAAEYRLSALAGTSFAQDRGEVVVSFEYSKQEGLLATDRALTANGARYLPPAGESPYANVLYNNTRVVLLSQNGFPMAADFYPGFGADIYNANGQSLAFNAQGQLTPFNFGGPTGSLFFSQGGDGLNLSSVSNLLSPVERYVGYGKASYELTDGIKAFTELSYASSTGTELRAQPVYNTLVFGDPSGTPGGNLQIPLSNPFLTPAQRETIAASLPPGQDYFYLGRANTDITAGLASTKVELYRIVAGLKGDTQLFGRALSWEVVGNYGRSKTKGQSRELVQQNFENALAGCPTGYANSPIATISATCAAFNPFGQQNSDAVRNYVTTIARPVADNEQFVFTADATGSPFAIWGGDVGVVLGYEYRQEIARFDPGAFFYGVPNPADPANRASYGRSVAIDPVYGKFHTNEVFGELRLPFISPAMGVPFFNRLEANFAGRYVDHSLAGGAFTWTAGGRWNPIEDFGIRGNFTRSIRAPAITELFNPTSPIFTTANDPCDSRFLTSGPNPAARQANCAAAGLPANFTSNIVDRTADGSVSGNPGLRNEVANSWTVGAIFTPRVVPGLSLSLDWVDIKLKGAILSLDAEQTLTACYDASSYPSGACSQFTRDAGGQITFIKTGYLNAASYKYSGLLGELNYRTATPFLGKDSRVAFNVSYQYIDKLEHRVGVGDLTIDANSIGFSRHQATGSLSYDNGPWGAFVQVEYIGGTELDPQAAPNTYDLPHRSPVAFVNASTHLDVTDKFTLRFLVDNVFDTKPPYPSPAGGGTITYFTGVMGRYFKVAATAKF